MTRSSRILLSASCRCIRLGRRIIGEQPATVTLSDPNCDSFAIGGTPGNQTLTCVVSTPPVCTVQGPGAASVGSNTSLTASCSPAATSWIWTGGSCATQTGQICTANEASPGVVPYTVKGTNGAGAGNQSSALNVSWNVGAPPAPTGCVASITTNPSTLTNAGGTATVSVSGCSPANVTYSWTKNVTSKLEHVGNSARGFASLGRHGRLYKHVHGYRSVMARRASHCPSRPRSCPEAVAVAQASISRHASRPATTAN